MKSILKLRLFFYNRVMDNFRIFDGNEGEYDTRPLEDERHLYPIGFSIRFIKIAAIMAKPQIVSCNIAVLAV
jgi:hypothetical protein